MGNTYYNKDTKEQYGENRPSNSYIYGQQDDGTWVINNPNYGQPGQLPYIRVSANDPRVPKMASEEVQDRQLSQFERSEIDKQLNDEAIRRGWGQGQWGKLWGGLIGTGVALGLGASYAPAMWELVAQNAPRLWSVIAPGTTGGKLIGSVAGAEALHGIANEAYQDITGSPNTYTRDAANFLGVGNIPNEYLRDLAYFGFDLADPAYPMADKVLSEGFRVANEMRRAATPQQLLLSEDVGKPVYGKKPYYYNDGAWNTEQMTQDINLGVKDFLNEIMSPEYAEAAIDNMEEAARMGLHYTPTFNKESFITTRDKGIKSSINWDKVNHDGNASTSFLGAGDQPAEVTFWGYSPVSYRQTGAHESSHASLHGVNGRAGVDIPNMEIAQKEYEFLKHKSSQVFVDDFSAGPYTFTGKGAQTGEGYANCRDLGKELGVQFAQPYPGDEKVLELLNSDAAKNSTKAGLIKGFRLDKEHLKYVWKALNGTQWIIFPGIVGGALIESNKQGNKLIPRAKSGIHIKKKNKGKFTEYCGGKVTDKCIQKAKHSSNPKLRKRATFAENARKWNK